MQQTPCRHHFTSVKSLHYKNIFQSPYICTFTNLCPIQELLILNNDMALPVVKSLAGCSDFSHTVLPYVYQLYDLPQQLLQSYNNPTELQNIYLATNPLISAFAFSLFLAPIFLLVSEVNRNYSQVDRCWSILPTLYNAHFVLYAHLSGLPTQRLDNVLAFSTVWSVRNIGFCGRYMF